MSSGTLVTKEVGVYELTPFTQLDYPNELACIVWFASCNLRCGYCHNPEMVRGHGNMPWADVAAHLERRKGRLSGVVFSGGEATLHPGIIRFAQHVKAMGFKLKLDSNGTRPDVIGNLLKENLLDMVAFDYKAPRHAYRRVTGVAERYWDKFSESLDLLIGSPHVRLEVRTTVHIDLLSEADVAAIRDDLTTRGYTGTYHVQNYRHGDTLGGMSPQSSIMNRDILAAGAKVRVVFRNF